jgi:hypothetical protein
MGAERRRTERMDSNLFVDFESLPLKEAIGRGVVVDVSLSGFGVETELDLGHETEYQCHIEIPLILRARVMRSEVKGQLKRYGLKFVGQGFIDKLIIKKLLKGRRSTRKVR